MTRKAVYEYLPIYGRHLFYGNDVDEIIKLLFEYFKESEIDIDHIDCESIPFGFAAPIIDTDDSEKTKAFVMFVREDADLGTVTHEATHLTNQIFVYLGQALDELNDEAQAYLTGYLAQSFMEKIRGAKPSRQGALSKRKKPKKVKK